MTVDMAEAPAPVVDRNRDDEWRAGVNVEIAVERVAPFSAKEGLRARFGIAR